MPGAVSPFERLRSRLRPRRAEGVRAPTEVSDNSAVRGVEWRTPEPTDLIFPKWQSELFETILEEENLRFDRDGRPRTAYSLRHTYISMRLMEGATPPSAKISARIGWAGLCQPDLNGTPSVVEEFALVPAPVDFNSVPQVWRLVAGFRVVC